MHSRPALPARSSSAPTSMSPSLKLGCLQRPACLEGCWPQMLRPPPYDCRLTSTSALMLGGTASVRQLLLPGCSTSTRLKLLTEGMEPQNQPEVQLKVLYQNWLATLLLASRGC